MFRIGYELPESGSFRAGFAQVDSSSTLLSLVGDFNGLYSFDLISGKKKKRNFADHGSCVYSSPSGSVVGSTACVHGRLMDSVHGRRAALRLPREQIGRRNRGVSLRDAKSAPRRTRSAALSPRAPTW